MIVTLIVLVVLILLSAFFSASETALTAASRPLLHELERDGNKGAARVNKLLTIRERLIGTILLGNNLVNILASAIATAFFIRMFGETGVVYATVAMTIIVLLFGEILPKTFALLHTTGTAVRVAPIMAVLVWALRPVTALLQAIVSVALFILRGGRKETASPAETLAELRGAIDLHTSEQSDTAAQAERHMLRSILDLTDVPVSDIMVHRSRVMSLDIDAPLEEIMKNVLESPYSRIPMWQGKPENVVGVLNIKALFRAIRNNGGQDRKSVV